MSTHASIGAQPWEVEGAAIQLCEIRHYPFLGPNSLYCLRHRLQTLDQAPFPPLSYLKWSFSEDSRKFLGK